MSDICLNFVQDSSTPLIDIFNNSLETTLNEHTPLKSLLVTERFNTNWYNDICANSKRNLRKLERKYRITKSTDNCLMFIIARRKHNRLLHIWHYINDNDISLDLHITRIALLIVNLI